MVTNEREQRGWEIANAFGSVKRIDAYSYTVTSQSGNGEYSIIKKNDQWSCSCPDHVYRHVKCKHIFACEISIALRTEVAIRKIEPMDNLTECMFCGSSNIVKFGIRNNKFGSIQRFGCKDCGKHFTFNIGFEKMKHDPKAITMAMQLYFGGESLRNTMRSLELMGIKVSHETVYRWIQKYSNLLKKYADKIKPSTSDVWRADELYVKVKGDMKYLFALIDDETRYWIAQEVAESKYKHDARNLLRMAKEIGCKTPTALITDGLPVYHDAFNKEFNTLKREAMHINTIKLSGDMNNNKMERFNGEVRDREKVTRGLKKNDTPVLAGYQVYHNFIRPHEALKGKTPAEACGITVNGNDKWKTLIQNASYQPKCYNEADQP
jgi:transposase-like protein